MKGNYVRTLLRINTLVLISSSVKKPSLIFEKVILIHSLFLLNNFFLVILRNVSEDKNVHLSISHSENIFDHGRKSCGHILGTDSDNTEEE